MTQWAKVSVFAIAAVFVLSALSALGAVDPTPVSANSPPEKPTVGSVQRTSLAEMWTNTGCYYCQFSDPPWVRLMAEFHDRPLISIAWHVWWPDITDPFQTGALPGMTKNIVDWYDIDGAPTVIMDGGGPGTSESLWASGASLDGGGAPDIPATYNTYKPLFVQQSAETTTVSISLQGDITSSTATVRATINPLDPVTQTNLRYKLVVYTDQLPYAGVYFDVHPLTVRRVIANEAISLTQGIPDVRTHTFALDPSWDPKNVGVVAYLQTNDRVQNTWSGSGAPDYNAEIVQAAQYRFVQPSVLIQRDEDLTAPDWKEYFDAELAQAQIPFQLYNTIETADSGSIDVKTMPTAADLMEYPAVVWSTGADASGTLDASEQAAIQTYLDSGRGNLFIIGENIADELWWTGTPPTYQRAFVQNYLHSNWWFNSTSQPSFTGRAGDPISASWAGTPIPRAGTMPTRITSFGSASATFDYCGTPCSSTTASAAAVKADHDADSRVVFMSLRYFETDDEPTPGTHRDSQIMNSVISWLDGSDGPTAAVTYPTGGEIFLPGTTEWITWDANDVLIPTNGIDIYYALDSANPTWVQIAAGEPNDGVFIWTVPNVQTETARIRVVARDMDMTTPDADVIDPMDFFIGNYAAVSIPFDGAATPMRLVSFPVELTDTTPSSVLASALANVGTVRWYDANDAADPWKSWSSARGGDLPALTNKMGFWVELTGSNIITVTGLWPTTTSITMKAGWNLVGFPSDNAMTVAQLKAATGATRVEGFDSAAASYNLKVLANSYNLQNTEGYWVYCPSDTLWIVAG